MRNILRIILPTLVVLALVALNIVAIRSLAEPAPQAAAADTEVSRLRYALTSANASAAIAADRAAALEREVALLAEHDAYAAYREHLGRQRLWDEAWAAHDNAERVMHDK